MSLSVSEIKRLLEEAGDIASYDDPLEGLSMEKKWPKEWFERTRSCIDYGRADNLTVERILESLLSCGALKEPPKPREWWMCNNCGARFETPQCKCQYSCRSIDIIHVREVLEVK